jgi:hypothetical protein
LDSPFAPGTKAPKGNRSQLATKPKGIPAANLDPFNNHQNIPSIQNFVEFHLKFAPPKCSMKVIYRVVSAKPWKNRSSSLVWSLVYLPPIPITTSFCSDVGPLDESEESQVWESEFLEEPSVSFPELGGLRVSLI